MTKAWRFVLYQVENVLLVTWELVLFLAKHFPTVLAVIELVVAIGLAVSMFLY